MIIHSRTPQRKRYAGIYAVLALLFATVALMGFGHQAEATPISAAVPSKTAAADSRAPRPTIVLVHGAFADASSWSGVVTRLQRRGYTVVAPALGLRGLTADAAYLANLLSQIKGPVVLVGHSYGGAVISTAATGAKNVRALVFVNAFAPENGEALSTVEKSSTDSALNPALKQFTYPTGNSTTATELLVDPAKFPAVFAADLPRDQAALLAATQRPAATAAFSEPAGPPAWKSLPSWAVISTGDKAAGTDVLLAMAKRAHATVTQLPGSHLIMLSRPDAVTAVILTAARSR